jgi:hypothetical protein
MLNNIIADLKNLEGKLVGKNSYFEKIYTNEAPINMISTIDVLENLKSYEMDNFIGYDFEKELEMEIDFDEYLELYGYEEIRSDNTYNWLAPLTNHINFRIYESKMMDDIIVELSVHRYGDVRCNYTEESYLKFQNDFEFYEVLSESRKNLFTIKDNKKYDIYIGVFSECPEIEICDIDNEYEYESVYGYEAYELLEELLNSNINIEVL